MDSLVTHFFDKDMPRNEEGGFTIKASHRPIAKPAPPHALGSPMGDKTLSTYEKASLGGYASSNPGALVGFGLLLGVAVVAGKVALDAAEGASGGAPGARPQSDAARQRRAGRSPAPRAARGAQ
eukprot:CAMPEP_0119140564 /NCGR_PEP_ID=MMETSP1310-20130426/29441_1 /TAXON_ID=464262 /ORGANISM="Genus nov. species nov., Strain RCC2339" /LENGTH=123 /DNA_ID=CAMNT_0007131923 /DNA_START=8 /DNA_END=377 /DNA_ORIENTATION=-